MIGGHCDGGLSCVSSVCAPPDGVTQTCRRHQLQFRHSTRSARTRERGKFDALFVSDHFNLGMSLLKRCATTALFDLLALPQSLAVVFKQPRLIATATTTKPDRPSTPRIGEA